MDDICGGELPEPMRHEGALNFFRVCLQKDDYQMNPTDLGWLRWIFDALDGENTSWLSRTRRAGCLPAVISRARAESAVPLEDCSGHIFTPDEREDLVRYVLYGAEIQRDDMIGKGLASLEHQRQGYPT